MTESEMLAALVALAKAHPYAAAAIALWFVLATGWKAQSKEKRDAWAKAYPRPVSVLRFALELLPDLLGAGRVLVFGVLRGMASRESAPPSIVVTMSKLEPPRETQAPPPPSEPGYVESWVLVALVVAVIAALAAGCSGGSLRDALRFNGVREVRHPIHGDCIEASLTVTAESINRSGTGYLGVCRGVLDAGAIGDAGVSE